MDSISFWQYCVLWGYLIYWGSLKRECQTRELYSQVLIAVVHCVLQLNAYLPRWSVSLTEFLVSYDGSFISNILAKKISTEAKQMLEKRTC